MLTRLAISEKGCASRCVAKVVSKPCRLIRKDRQAGFLCRLEQQVIAPVGVQRVNSARQHIDGDDVLVTGMAALFSRRIVRLDDNRALQSMIRIEPLVDHPAIKGTR